MSKNYHNYAKQFQNNNKAYEEPKIDEVTAVDATITIPEPELTATIPEPELVANVTVEVAPELPTSVAGVVSGCKKLNVRVKPSKDAAIVTTIAEGTEVTIEQPISDDVFYKVTLVSGITGFCMKQFIAVK